MKKLFTVLVACFLLLLSALPVYAAGGKVTYSGNAGNFVFEPGSEHSLTDLFPNFKGVMPGDSLTQKITVKNDADNKVKVKIYMRSLGAHEDSMEFLSQMGLTVQHSDDNTMAYMFDAAANETAQLTDWVCLGTLYSGGEVNLDVTLNVPTSLDNEYQSKIGYLDWEFRIEEFPAEPGDPEPPQTGDNFRMGLWLTLLISSLATFLILLVWRKKDREKQENAVYH
ncbi:MAG: hypothetical protein IJO75_02700 [Clostridia bacterium]|nr:hypothetical protein [Clostridia bacterium]